MAALLALAAYLAATGKPDLSVDVGFPFSEPNAPVFVVDDRPGGTGQLIIRPFKQTVGRVVLRNTSRYAARSAGVRVRFHGLAMTSTPNGWVGNMFISTVGGIEFQWDAAPGQLVHGRSERVLPAFVLEDATIRPDSSPSLEITLFADSAEPKVITLPVGTRREPLPQPDPVPAPPDSLLSMMRRAVARHAGRRA